MKTKLTLTLIAAAAFVAALLTTSCGLPFVASVSAEDPATGTKAAVSYDNVAGTRAEVRVTRSSK